MERRGGWGALGVAGVVLASRVPFLGAGYGADPDAWSMALVARDIAASGRYETSRLPGYPLPELAFAALAKGGPWALNGATALTSALSAGLLAACARRAGSKRPELVALAFAFTPVVYVASVSAMDYLWALAAILGSYCALLTRRALLAATLLGVAIGCRITSAAMLVPLALLVWQGAPQPRARAVLTFALVALGVGALAFLPVWLRYGSAFFTFSDDVHPDALHALHRMTAGTWGVLGSLGIAVAGVVVVVRWARGDLRGSPELARAQTPAWLLAVGLCAVAFVRLPIEAGYLIPAVPFVLLLLDAYLPARPFVATCALVALSSFADVVVEPVHPLGARRTVAFRPLGRGAILRDARTREENVETADRLARFGDALRAPSLVVVGPLAPEIAMRGTANANVSYVQSLRAPQLAAARHDGVEVYASTEGVRASRARGADLVAAGARVLP